MRNLLLIVVLSLCGACETLPTEGQACSADGACAEGHSCVSDVCVSTESQERGTEGGACYANETCNAGYECQSDVCVTDPAIGSEGNACFPNDTCNDGLNCVSNLCQAPANRDGACVTQDDCADESLLCVEHGAETLCRLQCDPAATSDVCGSKSTCFELSGQEGGVCLPAGRAGDACPCDEGYYCTVEDDDGALASVCRTLCSLPGGDECDADEECVAVDDSELAICQ